MIRENHFNWYRKILCAGFDAQMVGKDFQIIPQQKYELFKTINNKKITDILKSIGFRWSGDKNTSMWYANADRLRNDPNAISILEGLGIDMSLLGTASRPTAPSPQQSATPSQPSQATSSGRYVLAEAIGIPGIENGTPVAVWRSSTNKGLKWVWTDEKGENQALPLENPPNYYVKSVKDLNGNIVSNSNLDELFAKYYELNPNYKIEKMKPVEENPMEEDEDVVPRKDKKDLRIPENIISPYQKNIETEFLSSDKNIVINALAGTGKTSVLKHLASFKPEGERWLYLVFNKKNQIEAKDEFPSGVDVYTSHSFLGRVLQFNPENIPPTDLWSGDDAPPRRGKKMQRNLGATKASYFVDKIMEDDMVFPRSAPSAKYPNGKPNYNAKEAISKIVSLSKASAVNPLADDAEAQISQVIDDFFIATKLPDKSGRPTGKDYRPELIKRALFILKSCLPEDVDVPEHATVPKDLLSLRDHDDTLWFTAMRRNALNWPIQNYDVVLVDEVQDFNECQRIMLEILSSQAKVIAVGDPFQSIYMFRGAGEKAFSKTEETLVGTPRGAQVYPLPVNYRCGTKIIDFVNNHPLTPVDNLQAGMSYEGNVETGKKYDDTMNEISDYWKANKKTEMQTALLARTNAPLIEAALHFITNDIDFEIVGKDLSSELIKIIYDVIGKGKRAVHRSLEQFSLDLNDFLVERTRWWFHKVAMADKLKQVAEGVQSIQHILSNITEQDGKTGKQIFVDKRTGEQIKDTEGFLAYIRRRFGGIDMESGSKEDMAKIKELKKKDPRSFVTLTTAHKSKGLEFERVVILDIDNFPSPLAKNPAEIEQEKNGLYVALTRAKKDLNILQPQPKKNSGRGMRGW